jgi:hypothetical protein
MPTSDDDLPIEYREDVPADGVATATPLPPTIPEQPEEPSPRISVLPQPELESESDRKHREAMVFFREGVEQAKEVTKAQKKLEPVIAEAGRRIESMRARQYKLDQLDAGVAILKSIEFPEPYDSILDATVEELRKAIHNLYPVDG